MAAPKLVRSRILDGNNLAALSFDVALKATTAADPDSALNPSNYTLVNLDTNEPISIGAINYDATNRTARMLFEQLPPAPYRLTVASHVQSEQGIAIGGTGAAVDFRVFENVTATIPVRFSNTRINRKDGTLLVDVTLTNQGTFDVAGPIQLAFGALNDPNVAVVGATADSSKTIEVYATGKLLAAGQSITQTIALANPLVVDLDLTPTVRAALPPNQLPSFTTTPNIAASLGQAYSYAATARDPDGATVSYVLAKAPAGASISSTTGQLNWTPDRFTEPQVDFEVRAYDGRGAYRRQTWRVNVSGANRAPIVSPIEDRLISEGDTLSIPVSAFDPDGDRLFYLASNLPAGATFDAASQVLRWRPDANAAGVYEQVALIASDGYAETSVLFTITVVDRNTPPTISPLNNLLTREGDAISFRVVANDPDGQKLRYTSPNLPPGAFLDVNTGVFEWTPGFNQHGKFNLQFFVSDGIDTVRQTMSIDVANQNGQVQFAELTPFELFEGQTLKLRVAATDPEYPAANNNPINTSDDFFADLGQAIPPLTYTYSTLPAGATYDALTQLFTWTPGFAQSGRYDITFQVNDDGDGTGTTTSDTVTLSIIVADANGRPVIDALANRSLPVGATLDIPISARDPEGAGINLSVTVGQSTQLPGWAQVIDNGNGTGILRVSPLPGDRGDYRINVTATEQAANGALSESTQFILQITSLNEPPKFVSLYDRVALIDQATQFTVFVSDADQDALTFSAQGLPAGATLVNTGIYGQALFTWTPTAAQAGSHSITFQVQDSGNGNAAQRLTTTRTINLVVRNTNERPVLGLIGQQSVREGQTLVVQMQGTDADNDSLTYQAILMEGNAPANLPSGVEFNSSTGQLRWTPDFNQAGSYLFRLSVTDGAATRSEDVLVDVLDTNQAPVFSELPKLYGREGETLFFVINASDPDAQSVTYELMGISGDATQLPKGLRFDASARALEWKADYEAAGTYRLQFRATDPNGAQDQLSVDVQILPTNRAPTLAAPTRRTAAIGEQLAIAINTSDPDGDVVTLAATDLPLGAVLGADGVLRWTPQGFQAGETTIRLIASDGKSQTRRNVTLTATFEPASPDLRLVVTPSFPAVPGQTILVQPIAASDVGVGTATVKINGVAYALDDLGRANFVAKAPGLYEVMAEVTDAEGRTSRVTQNIFVRDPLDREAPVVEIVEITPPIIAEPRLLSINIGDATLASYVIELIRRDDGRIFRIGEGTLSICHQVTLDPANFVNGFYTLRATARDLGGLESVDTAEIEISSTVKTGSLSIVKHDLSVTLDGIPVDLIRQFDSLAIGNSSTSTNTVDIQGTTMGSAWTIPLINPQVALTRHSSEESFGFAPALQLGDRLIITLPDGKRVGFTFDPIATQPDGVTVYHPRWLADSGVAWTLKSLDRLLQKPASSSSFYMVGSGLPYNLTIASAQAESQTMLTLVAPSGVQYGYDLAGETEFGPRFELQRIVSADGQRLLRWTDSGLVADDGSRISLVRDASGRMTELVGPSGEHWLYRYDSRGQLSAAIDATAGKRTFYSYDDVGRVIMEAPTDAVGSLHNYSPTTGQWLGQTPLLQWLGGTRQFLSAPLASSLTAQSAKSYTLTFTDGELASSSTGKVTIGIEVTSSNFDPAAVTLSGVPAGYVATVAGRSVAMFTLNAGGTYALTIATANGQPASGNFTANIYLAGDVNNDRVINGLDQTAFDAALGSQVGEANYNVQADANRDGRVDAVDRGALLAAFGFVANRAPAAGNLSAISAFTGQSQVIFTGDLTTDAEEDPLFVRLRSTAATITELGGGFVSITPNQVGNIEVTVIADDGVLASSTLQLPLIGTSPEFASIAFANVGDLEVDANSLRLLSVIGTYNDGTTQSVPASLLRFTSSNPNVVAVTDAGLVLPRATSGYSRITASLGNLRTTFIVTIGASSDRLLEVYPGSYALRPGDTRQFIVRERVDNHILSLADVGSGTEYVIGNPDIATIDSEGLLHTLRAGTTDVYVIVGDHSFRVSVQVEDAQANGSVIDNDGGVVVGDGIYVGIPAGAFEKATPISVTAIPQSSLPYSLPDQWQLDGAVMLDWSGELAAYPLSLDFPAPAGRQAGDRVYLFQAVDVTHDDGVIEHAWEIVDSMLVTADGRMRTTSPPNLGVLARQRSDFTTLVKPSVWGQMAFGTPSVGTLMTAMADLKFRQSQAPLVSIDRVTNARDDGSRYYSSAGFFGDFIVPAVADFRISLNVHAASPSGLSLVETTGVELRAGERPEFAVPLKPRVVLSKPTPQIQSARVGILRIGSEEVAAVELTGSFLLDADSVPVPKSTVGTTVDDLYVTIEIGGRDGFKINDKEQIAGGRDTKITTGLEIIDGKLYARIPANAMVAGGTITVTRRQAAPADGRIVIQEVTSNPVQPLVLGKYTFVPNGGDSTLAIYDMTAQETFEYPVSEQGTKSATKPAPQEVARVRLANGFTTSQVAPRKSVASVDGSLLYVTLENLGAVSVIDVVALHEIDTNLNDTGVTPIMLPAGARPYDIATSPDGRMLYVTDYNLGTLYGIDVDPTSDTFHTVIATININRDASGNRLAPLGFRGLVVAGDSRSVYVTAPGQTCLVALVPMKDMYWSSMWCPCVVK